MILYGLLLIMGMALIVLAFVKFQKTKALINVGIVTEASVTSLEEVDTADGIAYKPVFSYQDSDEKERTYMSPVASFPADFEVGDRVQLIYDPDTDGNIRLLSYWGLFRWTIIGLAVSIPLLVIGGGYFLYLRNFGL